MIPAEIQEKLRQKYNPEGSLLRLAQLRMLEILIFVDKICSENGIEYWLDSGTLLGAARHGGFIPWDDDVDICMTRDNYAKFKDLMINKNPSKEFVLQCHDTDSHYYQNYGVVRDLNTEYIMPGKMHNIRKYKGLQIDIFLVDDKTDKRLFELARAYYLLFIQNPYLPEKKKFHLFSPFVPLASLIFRRFILPLMRLLPVSKKDYYRMSYGLAFRSIRMKKDIYPLTRISFEQHDFFAPRNYANYLTRLYGNWDTMPNTDKIYSHNTSFIFK